MLDLYIEIYKLCFVFYICFGEGWVICDIEN